MGHFSKKSLATHPTPRRRKIPSLSLSSCHHPLTSPNRQAVPVLPLSSARWVYGLVCSRDASNKEERTRLEVAMDGNNKLHLLPKTKPLGSQWARMFDRGFPMTHQEKTCVPSAYAHRLTPRNPEALAARPGVVGWEVCGVCLSAEPLRMARGHGAWPLCCRYTTLPQLLPVIHFIHLANDWPTFSSQQMKTMEVFGLSAGTSRSDHIIATSPKRKMPQKGTLGEREHKQNPCYYYHHCWCYISPTTTATTEWCEA